MNIARDESAMKLPKQQPRRNVLPRAHSSESGQVIVLVLILLALAGGAFWYANSARAQKEKQAWAFANDVANRVILQRDTRVLDLSFSPGAKLTYPPSWRERLLEFIRAQGQPHSDIRLTGDVEFTHRFLDPQGHFRAELDYDNGPAYLEFRISHPGVLWQIDYINWIWQRPPELPAATPSPTPAPTPTRGLPSPSPPRRKHKQR